MYIESSVRTLTKTISWRVVATMTTAILVYIFTGEFTMAITIGSLEVVAKMALYYFHERAWNKLNFGRREIEPVVFWFTGLTSSGKRNFADALAKKIADVGIKRDTLYSMSVRKIIPEIGYSLVDRNNHARRIGFLAGQLESHGITTIVSITSPSKKSREFARQVCKNFVEIHVATEKEKCIERDDTGLWRQALDGEIKDFVGVDIPFEAPEAAEFSVKIDETDPEEFAAQTVKKYFNL